ncbi:alanine racemase [Virgibacillus kimchii]
MQIKANQLTTHHPTVAVIDLQAYRENIAKLKSLTKHSEFMAVIKTNAYGHGIVKMGFEAVQAGAHRLGVTSIEEGVLLRENGITVPIHLLSAVMPERAVDIVAHNLVASISSKKLATAISEEAVKQGRTAAVHLKIDTGLHRFGLHPQEAVSFCRDVYHLPGLLWEGIYTHFSSADEGEWDKTEKEFTLFKETVSKLKEHDFYFPVQHVGGSTITMEKPEMHLDMVRPGIALFGYPPDVRQNELIDLKPVMTLKTKVLLVRELPPNMPIGYGGSYITSGTEKIAVIAIGHGDGYQRTFSNNGEMLIGGKRANIIGTISLDQTMVDVTHVPDVQEGDEVIIIGRQNKDEIHAREVAGWAHTIVDEVLASLLERIKRIYI